MRSISSVRTLSSMGTIAFSFLIARSRSCGCTALASLASVNNCFEEVIADLLRGVQSRRKQRRQAQKGFATQVRRLRDRHGGTLRGKHPYRDLQSLTRWIHDYNRTVAPLGVANSLENSVAERMERIEDLYARIFRTQGIVGADGFIRTCIASCSAADSPPMAPAGSLAARILSSFLIRCSAVSSANFSCCLWEGLFGKVAFTSPASCAIWPRESPASRDGANRLALPAEL